MEREQDSLSLNLVRCIRITSLAWLAGACTCERTGFHSQMEPQQVQPVPASRLVCVEVGLSTQLTMPSVASEGTTVTSNFVSF